MGLIDILVLLTITLSALIAFSRGLVRELLGLTAWVLAIVGAIYGVEYIQPLFLKYIKNQMLANIAGIGTISLLILVVCTIINAKIAKRLRKSALSGLVQDGRGDLAGDQLKYVVRHTDVESLGLAIYVRRDGEVLLAVDRVGLLHVAERREERFPVYRPY